jgi:hypothetical protein
MFKIALLSTIVLLLALAFWLAGELAFLAPYRRLIWERHGTHVAGFAAALSVNILAGVYALCRYLLLADTGRKLAHLERQLRAGEGISDELAARLRE